MINNYMPKQIHFGWKNKLWQRQSVSVYAQFIEKHVLSINFHLSKRVLPKNQEFDDEKFWDNLKIKGSYSESVNTLYDHWKLIKPFAHLNTSLIIWILQNHVEPLISFYELILTELDDDHDLELLPKFLRASQNNLRAQINENLERMSVLKNHIYYGLMARCNAHQILNSSRQVEDVLAALALEVNQLNVLEQPLKILEPYTATLNDDHRITIYDIFKRLKKQAQLQNAHVIGNINFDKLILDEIIAPIPGRHPKILREKKDIKQDKRSLHQFIRDNFKALKQKSFIRQIFSLEEVVKPSLYIPKRVANWCNIAWKLRYFILTACCYLGYLFLLAHIAPLIITLFGATIFNFVSSVLFITLGIAPLWYLIAQGIAQVFANRKTNEIINSMVQLEATQRFIGDKLSQTPHDLAHFQITELMLEIIVHQGKNHCEMIQIKRVNFLERTFCADSILSQVEPINTRLEQQNQSMCSLAKQLAHHIAARMGEEIESLIIDIKQKRLIKAIDNQQIVSLKKFVAKFGDKNAITLFETNTNVSNRWLVNIETFAFSSHQHDASNPYPWGRQEIRKDILTGWDTLLSSFIVDNNKKQASLALNAFIKGDKELTKHKLQEKVNVLWQDGQATQALAKIQEVLFKTLYDRQPQVSSALSANNKARISKWYHDNEKAINQAHEVFSLIMSSINNSTEDFEALVDKYSDAQLSKYYQLLDGADFYFMSQTVNDKQYDKQNLVRKFFEDYQGQSSRAFQFIRFIPKDYQARVALDVAKKRIIWFLTHLDSINLARPFNEEDINIFKNLWVEKLDFYVTTQIKQSSQFKEKGSQNMLLFLKACARNGLGSANQLHKEYEKTCNSKSVSGTFAKEILTQRNLQLKTKNITEQPQPVIENKNPCQVDR